MPIKLSYGYIVTSSEGAVIEMVYNDKISKKWNKNIKSVYIRSYEMLEKFSSEEENKRVEGESENSKKLEKYMDEIVGYNSTSFYREEATFTTNIEFLNSTAKNIMRYYDADAVIMPGSNLKKDLKKGLYRRKEIEEIFSKDKLQICIINNEELNKIEKERVNRKGEEGYMYILRSPKKIMKKSYRVVMTENSKKYLNGIDYEEIFTTNLNPNSFVPRGNYEEK